MHSFQCCDGQWYPKPMFALDVVVVWRGVLHDTVPFNQYMVFRM